MASLLANPTSFLGMYILLGFLVHMGFFPSLGDGRSGSGKVAEPYSTYLTLFGKGETLLPLPACIYDAVTFQLLVSETHGGL